MYSPVPAGERKERPRRPLPAVWWFAATSVPLSAPTRARRFAWVFVESTVSRQTTRRLSLDHKSRRQLYSV